MAKRIVTQDLKLRYAVIRGKELDHVKAIADAVNIEIQELFPLPEGTLTRDDDIQELLDNVDQALKTITQIKEQRASPATREQWYSMVASRFRVLLATPLAQELDDIYRDLKESQLNARNESERRIAENSQAQAVNNYSSAPSASPSTQQSTIVNSGGNVFGNISSKSRSMLSLPKISNRSTSRKLPISSQQDLPTLSFPQYNVGQGQYSAPNLPQNAYMAEHNTGWQGYPSEILTNLPKPGFPGQIVSWEEYNNPPELPPRRASEENELSAPFRAASQAFRSIPCLPAVRPGLVGSIPAAGTSGNSGNYNGPSGPHNVINTGNSIAASGYVPGHAHQPSVDTTHTTHTTHTTNTFGVRISRHTSMHNNVSSSSLGSSGSHQSSEKSGKKQHGRQASTSTSTYGQASREGQSSGAGSSGSSLRSPGASY
ncbi:uncharacterized protein BT62DRAFT_937227 [Guyanagaster necrorhizus]|uniref:Uncharacterized protein n=1 Tax=Guyanagaster necrorhizus TaxID=856835 RepID=A0A9P8ANY0_9AGAR|nr:uncharacterized protein BT62DRAFT_937227 [Guyanagaster necrorhizus MCA 3950]KAG7441307.1 hypothetical protein BT62DRAFT_937227 [Guyanagaster necrorhizus MCA 3950]